MPDDNFDIINERQETSTQMTVDSMERVEDLARQMALTRAMVIEMAIRRLANKLLTPEQWNEATLRAGRE